eukprot:jgi/Chlat1/694/Chrsp104S01282
MALFARGAGALRRQVTASAAASVVGVTSCSRDSCALPPYVRFAASSSTATADVHIGAHTHSGPPSLKPMSEIPGPRGLPFGLGITLRAVKHLGNLTELHKELRKEYGDIVQYTRLLKLSFATKGGIHRDRSLISGKTTVIASWVAPVSEVASEFANYIRREVDANGVLVDMQKRVALYTMETIVRLVLGRTMHALGPATPAPEVGEFIAAARNMFAYTEKVMFGLPLHKLYKTANYKGLEKAWDDMFRIAGTMVRERIARFEREGGAVVDDLLSSLLASGSDLTVKEHVVNGVDMVSGGVDTTSVSITWCLYHLAKNPDVQQQVYNEVASVLGDREVVTAADLQHLPLVKAAVKETMRLTPVVPQHGRILGTSITIDAYHVGHDPNLFKDPDRFYPQRFLGKDKQHSPFATIPFGHGARRCIGSYLALMETHVAVACLLQKFELLHHGPPVGTRTALTILPDRSVDLEFRART